MPQRVSLPRKSIEPNLSLSLSQSRHFCCLGSSNHYGPQPTTKKIFWKYTLLGYSGSLATNMTFVFRSEAYLSRYGNFYQEQQTAFFYFSLYFLVKVIITWQIMPQIEKLLSYSWSATSDPDNPQKMLIFEKNFFFKNHGWWALNTKSTPKPKPKPNKPSFKFWSF